MKSLAKKALSPPTGASEGRREALEDQYLREFLERVRAKIVIMGVGGAGSNTITRLNALGLEGVVTVAANTDAQHLLESVADRKLLLGRELCGGSGAGGDPKIGEEAAKESEPEIREMLDGADIVFLMAGLGGGTGTGGLPVIASIAKELGAVVVSMVTLPFEAEGKRRNEIAREGLANVLKSSDTVVIVNNDRILELVGDRPLHEAFLIADEIMARSVKGVVELVTKPGLINVDFADLRAVLERGGPAILAFGESEGEDRSVEAVEDALANPLLEADISGAKAAVVNITCGPDLSLQEMKRVVETVVSALDPEANVIWGARIEDDLEGVVQVLLIVTGVTSPYIEELEGVGREEKREREAAVSPLEPTKPTIGIRRPAARGKKDILGDLGIEGV